MTPAADIPIQAKADIQITPPALSGVTYSPTLLAVLSAVGAIVSQIVAYGIITAEQAQLAVSIGGPLIALGVLAYDVFVRHVKANHALALATGPLRALEPQIGQMFGEIKHADPAAAPLIDEAALIERVASGALAQVSANLASAAAHRTPSPLAGGVGGSTGAV